MMASKRERPTLDIVRKLDRAKEHLGDAQKILRDFHYSEYRFVPEQDADPEFIAFRVRLPKPSHDLVMVIGDCIHNLRCVLDHLVWQLAHKLSPNRTDQERRRNMFPICWSPGEFKDQVARKRLNGLPRKAVKLIESVQPYRARNDALGILSELENIDKHRSLVLTTSVAVGAYRNSLEAKGFHLPLWREVLYDGAVGFRARRRVIPASLGPVTERANAATPERLKTGHVR